MWEEIKWSDWLLNALAALGNFGTGSCFALPVWILSSSLSSFFFVSSMSCCLLNLYSNSAFIQLLCRDALAVLCFPKCMQILQFKALGLLKFCIYTNGGVANRAQNSNVRSVITLFPHCYIDAFHVEINLFLFCLLW